MLENLIDQLTKDLELEGSLATESPGVFAVPLDEDLTVTITPLGQVGVSFRCDFAKCPDSQNEDLFKEALLANLFGQGTNGAVIGLNEGNKKLTLLRDVPYLVDYKHFKDTLEEFINIIDFWRDESLNLSKGS